MTELARNLDCREPIPRKQICELTVKNFRCFARYELKIDKPHLLIVGPNGAGKSSLLEAIYYTSYASSFRTRNSSQLIREGADAFSIKLSLLDKELGAEEIFVGFSTHKKVLKINGDSLKSHSPISALFKCLTLTQEDMEIVSEGPERRRFFLNQSHHASEFSWPEKARRARQILEQRNALLAQNYVNPQSLEIWTMQHWQVTREIQRWRVSFIEKLNIAADLLLAKYLDEFKVRIKITYKPVADCMQEEFGEFMAASRRTRLFEKESIFRRTMFGGHLDDFGITIHGRCARNFASRGEQKLLTLILKCAALEILEDSGTRISCILIDDFLTDLDLNRVEKCRQILAKFNIQTIMTAPMMRREIFPQSNLMQEIILNSV